MKVIVKVLIGILYLQIIFTYLSCNKKNEIFLIATGTFNEVRFYKNSMEFELVQDEIKAKGKYEFKNDTFFLTYNGDYPYSEDRGCIRNAGDENGFLSRMLVIDKPGHLASADDKEFSANIMENNTGIGCTRKIKQLPSSILINIPFEKEWKDSIRTCFSKYVKKGKINKEIIETTETSERFTTYLGEIKYTNGKTMFHVISQFYMIQAAMTKHGHSCIIFLNEKKETVKIYAPGMPEDLPIKLQINELFFKHEGQLYSIHIVEPLPMLLCIPEIGCCENLF